MICCEQIVLRKFEPRDVEALYLFKNRSGSRSVLNGILVWLCTEQT